jgi:hypothetical protein
MQKESGKYFLSYKVFDVKKPNNFEGLKNLHKFIEEGLEEPKKEKPVT